MTQALVNPAILRWARERANQTLDSLAAAMHVKFTQVAAWEDGLEHPTFKQAQNWAMACHVPFGFLYLAQPPEDPLPIPDLRTIEGVPPTKPSIDLLDTIRDVLRKQDWYIDYLTDQGHRPLEFVGRFSLNSRSEDIAADIRHWLKVNPAPRKRTDDVYLTELIAAAEAAGISVMRSGMVNGNTHRKLDVAEFRGFAVSDKLAPVVFLNSADAPAARVFTLLHELAHIWIGISGISDTSVGNSRREEVLCNATAGEFLVPRDEFVSRWNSHVFWEENLEPLASTFNVSKLVIGRRAADLGLIDKKLYSDYYLAEWQKYRARDKGEGGSYYATAGAKNSKVISRAVVAETLSGRILLREAGKLLGIQPSKIKKYATTLGL